jgi:hypothetical protein
MPPARFELTAPGLGILCSILLSYGGIRAQVIFILSSKLLGSLLSSFLKIGQIFNFINMIHLDCFPRRPMFWTVIACVALLSGCSASDSPLSISLYNPKTGVQRTCSAKESSSKDVSALSNAVETCAKQLEARGFIRSDSR